MLTNSQVQIRDPFIVTYEGKYYLFGSTDKNIWGIGTGFDYYRGGDLENWEGPFPAFRPEADFWATHNFWAPEVHKYKEKFYMFATFKAENVCRGTQILVSDSLEEPFRPHSLGRVTPDSWECLDGTFYVDETGMPWLVFCHEWVQIYDGAICAVRLTEDLLTTEGEVYTLFSASEAQWATPLTKKFDDNIPRFCTDGPFLYKGESGRLYMLWSSFKSGVYQIGYARSLDGKITGKWIQNDDSLYSGDAGHGMLFKTFDGRLMLTIHTPNETPLERPIFIEIIERKDGLKALD